MQGRKSTQVVGPNETQVERKLKACVRLAKALEIDMMCIW